MKWILTPALLGCLWAGLPTHPIFADPPGKKAPQTAAKPVRVPSTRRAASKPNPTAPTKVGQAKPVKTAAKPVKTSDPVAKPPIKQSSATRPKTRVSIANKALLIGEEVVIRASASHQAKALKTATFQELVLIDSVTPTREIMPGKTGKCFEYPWVKVRTADNTTGWVTGRNVFRLITTDKKLLQDPPKDFICDGVAYKIGLTHNYFIGAADPQGLTLCQENDLYPLVMYSTDYKKVYLIELVGAKSAAFKYFVIHDHDLQTDEVKKVEVRPVVLKLTVDSTFPDRCERWEVFIRAVEGGFQGEAVLINKVKPCEGTFPQPDDEEETTT